MITIRTPFRISLFGGSTDYTSFYRKHGSFLIGMTIDKYCYQSMRIRPQILPKESVITYSKLQTVQTWEEIQNPLIRETLKYRGIKDNIELFSFSDIPSRTGLGGSSSYCVGLLYLLDQIYGKKIDKKELVKDAVTIERVVLKEAGGIQDQIWPVYGGFNSIEIGPDDSFHVKPLPITEDFRNKIESSILLIYTNEQRHQDEIAKSHEDKDKLKILEIAKEAYTYFVKEDIENIGKLLYEGWKEKRGISSLITNSKIDTIIASVMNCGAYGAKLLGTGGCGFIMVICNSKIKEKLTETYKDCILDVKIESEGVSQIYP